MGPGAPQKQTLPLKEGTWRDEAALVGSVEGWVLVFKREEMRGMDSCPSPLVSPQFRRTDEKRATREAAFWIVTD